jgi:hypothetical protein
MTIKKTARRVVPGCLGGCRETSGVVWVSLFGASSLGWERLNPEGSESIPWSLQAESASLALGASTIRGAVLCMVAAAVMRPGLQTILSLAVAAFSFP